MVSNPAWQEVRFPVLREAVRFIPHGRSGALSAKCASFPGRLGKPILNSNRCALKSMLNPNLAMPSECGAMGDAGQKGSGRDYEKLAVLIQKVFQPSDARTEILALDRIVSSKILSQEIRETGSRLARSRSCDALRGELPDAGFYPWTTGIGRG